MEFLPRPMVDWLDPMQLAMTGLKAVMASKFGGYADKREMQAALNVSAAAGNPDGDYSDRDELWFDYVADIGDGFASTYTVARALSDALQLAEATLPRGRFVILGGDQVYPTASQKEYQNRLLGPYRAALPWTADPPDLYALPGNHDWYDGLTSFLRLFCQRRWIGGWRTRQRRSYFAIRLPHDWWIWGIDSQLESDIDRPQLDYFDRLAKQMRADGATEQKIILVTAEPNWVFSGAEGARETFSPVEESAFKTLGWFEQRYIRDNHFRLRLVIAGDFHHYVRYASADGTQRMTSGGGGAYLMATHQMPAAIALPEGTYQRAQCYPPSETSEAMAADVLALPVRNRRFAALLAGAYALLGMTMMTALLPAVLFAITLILLFYSYTRSHAQKHPKLNGIVGGLHGAAHVALAVAATLAGGALGSPWGVVGSVIGAFVTAAAAGGILGSLVFAAFLLQMSRTTGAHTEEVFSSMAIANFKNFLRMHIGRDGTLTIHPIGIDEVVTDWKFEEVLPEQCGRSWYLSKTPIAAKRIEDPVVVH